MNAMFTCLRLATKSAPLQNNSTRAVIAFPISLQLTRHFTSTTPINSNKKTTLIIGSSGSLGSTIASQLKNYHDCIVIGSDIYPPSIDRADCIDAFIQLPNNNGNDHNNDDDTGSNISIDNLINILNGGLNDVTEGEHIELDAIICANGGFAMDDDAHYDEKKNNNQSQIGKVYEQMLQMNYYPIVAAGEIAKKYMTTKNDGLFIIFGAVAALTPAPGMMAYTSSKGAAHYYVQTLGSMTGKALMKEYKNQRNSEMGMKMRREGRYLDNMSAVGILPIMLDTVSNREALPDEDFSSWTKTGDIAKEIGIWIDTPELRPHSGSLMKVITKNDVTSFKLAR